MNSNPTGTALIATPMWLPQVVWRLPWFAAMLDELLFVLFGLFALAPWRLLAQVVLFVRKHCGEPCCCMSVDGLVILIKDGLPSCGFAIVKVICPLPGGQSSIPLPPLEMWLIARSVRSTCVFC